MKFRISALALALAAAGCAPVEDQGGRDAGAQAKAVAPVAAVQEVTDAQNGATVTMAVGGQLRVALAGNRTTGYYWEVAEKPANLTAAGADYVQDAAAPGMVGVGGTERFTFRATGRGTGRLRLDHRGAGGRGVADSWQINVVVR
jgi:predicted secreted protein